MASKKSSVKTNKKALEILSQIFQAEMAGIIRYMHYSFMIMGYHRIPIQAWFRAQANESMTHATQIGEKITAMGGHPPMVAMKIEESNNHDVRNILEESLEFESKTLELYKKLSKAAGNDIALEEMAREFVKLETEHLEEVQKMLFTV